MEELKMSTPTRLLKKSSSTANSLNKPNKNYLPSRFVAEKSVNKIFPQEALHQVQQLARTNDLTKSGVQLKLKPNAEASSKIVDLYTKKQENESKEFQTKPMKRYESDYLNFKNIFVNPREEELKRIKAKDINIEKQELLSSGTSAFEAGKKTLDKLKLEPLAATLSNSPDKKQLASTLDMKKFVEAGLQYLDSRQDAEVVDSKGANFFEEQMKVQPPDLPNSSIASTLAPGNGYAPSIPLTYMLKEGKTNLRDLLIRAKAGIQAEDVQKEAHLSFFLGMVYESRREYDLAAKLYKRFLGFARTMEDKIGMALGANRVAISEYNRGNIAKSISFHQQNLKLSDKENTFAGFYNMGVCLRRLERYSEALQYFENALQWGLQRDEMECTCMTYGQLGVTYMRMQLFEEALQNFEKCLEHSRRLHKVQMEMDILLYITKITSRLELKSAHSTTALLEQTLQCAKTLDDRRIYGLTVCNLGILQGGLLYDSLKSSTDRKNEPEKEIEEIDN